MLSEARKMLKLVAETSAVCLRALLEHIDRHPSRLWATNGAVIAMAVTDVMLQAKLVLSLILLILSILLSATALYRKWFGKRPQQDPEI